MITLTGYESAVLHYVATASVACDIKLITTYALDAHFDEILSEDVSKVMDYVMFKEDAGLSAEAVSVGDFILNKVSNGEWCPRLYSGSHKQSPWVETL